MLTNGGSGGRVTSAFVHAGIARRIVVGGILCLLVAADGAYGQREVPVWTLLPSTGPSARHGHGMAYDSARGRVVLFGGCAASTTPLNDLWEWDGVAWSSPSLPPGSDRPSARYYAGMAYDSARRVVVLYGGYAPAREADTWEWNGTTWKSCGPGLPGSRWGHAMAYDAGRGVVVLFGGQDSQGVRKNDTWEWDGGNWTQVIFPPGASLPTPRAYSSMTYDPDSGLIVLFGGHQDGASPYCADTWTFDGTAWTLRSSSGPAAREGAGLAYDAARNVLVLFGGYAAAGLKQDTWKGQWSGNALSWTQEPGAGPTARCYHGMVYAGKVLLFGGQVSGGYENRETWDYGENLTPKWACCFADGSCQDLAEAHCLGAQGVSWREGVRCDAAPCALPPPEASYFLGDQPLSGSAAHQINTATGNFHYNEVDLSIASRRVPLIFARHYNSMDRSAGPLGQGWRHTYHITLTPDNPPTRPFVTITWADGRATFWKRDGANWTPATRDLYDKMTYSAGVWTVTRTNLDRYEFDLSGRLLSIIPRGNSNNAITLEYDPVQTTRLKKVTDPAGHCLDFGYNENGLLTSVTDHTLRSVRFSYPAGRLAQVTDVLGGHIDYEYDANGYLKKVKDQRQPQVTVVTNTYAPDGTGRVVQYVDGNGNTTRFQYRAGETEIKQTVGGREIKRLHKSEMVYQRQTIDQDPLGHQVVYTYDENLNRKTMTDRNGNVTSFTYDALGNVTSVTDPNDPADPADGGVTTFEYNDPNVPHLPTRKTDALGYVTEWTYDAHGNLLTERRNLTVPPSSSFVQKSWTYNTFDQRLTETDERGNQREWVYDGDGLLTEERFWDRTDPNSPVLVGRAWFQHDSRWRLERVTDGRGSGPLDPAYTTRRYYDADDRVTRIESPPVGGRSHLIVRTFSYDPVGNLTSETDGNGNVTTYAYDANNNLRFVYQPLGRTTQYQYDELNRRIRTINANNYATAATYDDADRLTETRHALNNVWTYTHDAHGNVLTQTDPSGVTLTYAYDKLHRRTRRTDELGHTWQTQYDKLGRVTRTIDATNQATQYFYDALGRLTRVVDAAGGQTDYTYDAAGNLLQILDANGHIVSKRQYDTRNRLVWAEDGNSNYYTYGYDFVGNQTWVRDANAQPDGPVTTLTYDAVNRRTGIYYPDGSWVTFAYDDNGNRTRMTESAAPDNPSLFGYDALNQLVSSVDRFGMRVDYGYDLVGNRTRLVYPGNKVLTYGYDAANRLTSISDWAQPSRVTTYTYTGFRLLTTMYPNGVLETRDYDAAGRLTGLTTTRGGSPVLSFGWTRNGEGEPLTATETNTLPPVIPTRVVGYDYDDDNRLTESSKGTYTYDRNGNLTSRTIGGVLTEFQYDNEDRLVRQETGASVVQHVYDGDGNRIARIDNVGTTRYVIDRGRSMSHVLCETNAAGQIVAYYIHGPTLVARIDAAGTARYYHANDLGSVAALTDAAGNVTDRYAYDPYGLPAGDEGSTPNAFTFVGGLGVMVEADNLYFMRARFYDPDTGRFLGKDPIVGRLTNPLELNRYPYAINNPLIHVDPSGKIWWFLDVIKRLVQQIVRGSPASQGQSGGGAAGHSSSGGAASSGGGSSGHGRPSGSLPSPLDMLLQAMRSGLGRPSSSSSSSTASPGFVGPPLPPNYMKPAPRSDFVGPVWQPPTAEPSLPTRCRLQQSYYDSRFVIHPPPVAYEHWNDRGVSGYNYGTVSGHELGARLVDQSINTIFRRVGPVSSPSCSYIDCPVEGPYRLLWIYGVERGLYEADKVKFGIE